MLSLNHDKEVLIIGGLLSEKFPESTLLKEIYSFANNTDFNKLSHLYVLANLYKYVSNCPLEPTKWLLPPLTVQLG